MKRNELIADWAGRLSVFGFCWMVVMCVFNASTVAMPIAHAGYFLFAVPWLVWVVMSGVWRYRFRREHLLSFAMILFFAFELFYLPTEGNTYLKGAMEKRYPLVLFALAGLFGYHEKLSFRLIVDVMACVSTVAVAAVVMDAGLVRLIVSPERSYIFATSRVAIVNSHMVFNFYLNVMLVGMWWIWFRCGERTLWRGILYLVASLLAMSALSISEGRNGLVTFLFLTFSITTIECWHRWRWRAIAVVGFMVVVGLAIVKFNPRFQQYGFNNGARNAYWRSAIELIEERPLTGYGVNNAQEEYDKVNMKYQIGDLADYWLVRKEVRFVDAHNQFLQTTLEFGIIGLLLLLSLYILPVVLASEGRRMLMAALMLVCVLQSMTDMFITGQFCTLYCIITQAVVSFSVMCSQAAKNSV